MFLSGYEVRAVIDDKQFAVLSSSRPFGRGSPKVRTTSARPSSTASIRKPISAGADPHRRPPHLSRKRTAPLEHHLRCRSVHITCSWTLSKTVTSVRLPENRTETFICPTNTILLLALIQLDCPPKENLLQSILSSFRTFT